MTLSERERMMYVAGGPTSWLGAYLDYASRMTDAPLAFHIGGGLAALAGAVGSNVSWRGGGHREQWPNLYLLLVAPSGIMRKSTSVDTPTNLLVRARPGAILDREFSPEQFIRNLAGNPTSVLKESEFASLLERMKSSYMQGMKQRLTDLYDCQESYDRIIQGQSGKGERISIVKPALTILAASTLDWLVESLTENDMRSGFMPRFLFFAASQKEPEPAGGYWADSDKTMGNALVQVLRDYSRMPHAVVTFAAARRRMVEWTAERSSDAETGKAPDELMGLYSRLGHHLSKLCALLALSDASGPYTSYEIDEEIAARAIDLMEWILEGTARLFDERIIFSKFEQSAQKVLHLIGAEIDWSHLLKKMKTSSSDLDRVMKTLKERGQIEETNEMTSGRPRRVIRRARPDGFDDADDTGGERRGEKGNEVGKEAPRGHVTPITPINRVRAVGKEG